MTSEKTSRLIEKIKRLLALSSSDNPHEAEQASIKAMQLMQKHNIELYEVEDVKEEEFKREIFNSATRRFEHDKFIASIIHHHFSVRIITQRYHGKKTETIAFGTEANLAVAKHVYNFLRRAFVECWETYRKETGATAKSRASYYHGLWHGVHNKLKEEKERQETCNALVVLEHKLDENFKKNNPGLKSTRDRVKIKDRQAHTAGVETGRSLNIIQALN